MSFFEDQILPYCLNLAMRNRIFLPYRKRVIGTAAGRVLEIGIGSGLNLPFYTDRATQVVGLEPSEKLVGMTRRMSKKAPVPLSLQAGSAEAIPFEEASFDTVVTTWTLCTIPGVHTALREMRRVLKPGGRLLFAEHGAAPEAGVLKWQNRLTPAWKKIAGGCHMNRPIGRLVEGCGFAIEQLETGYAKGPRPLAYMYEGTGRVA